MSYDLFLQPRAHAPDATALLEYFRGRRNFTVENGQALYRNDYTGVYFHFEKNSGEDGYPIAFNVNFFRPSFFALEAEREVGAFVRQFDCVVLDPQTDGMGEGDYSGDRLIAGWNRGNAFAVEVMLKRTADTAQTIPTLPTDHLLQIWRWNDGVQALQARRGRNIFVPRIMVRRIDGELATVASWGDGVSTIFPKVDYLIVVRDKLAPSKFFVRTRDAIVVPWERVRPLLEKHGAPQEGGALALEYRRAPADVAAFIRSLPPENPSIERIDFGSIIDRELVDRANARKQA